MTSLVPIVSCAQPLSFNNSVIDSFSEKMFCQSLRVDYSYSTQQTIWNHFHLQPIDKRNFVYTIRLAIQFKYYIPAAKVSYIISPDFFHRSHWLHL